MRALSSATTFQVSDLETSLRDYIDVLGFTEHFRFGDYAGIRYDEIEIHLSGPGATNKRAVGQGSLYIFCDEVDGYHDQITKRGAVTQAPPRNYDYGMRDFVVEDPDKNLIAFGQEIKK